MNVCKCIDCPYFNKTCTRYPISKACHLFPIFPGKFYSSMYWLELKANDTEISDIKKANGEFLANDERYQEDLALDKSGTNVFYRNKRTNNV